MTLWKDKLNCVEEMGVVLEWPPLAHSLHKTLIAFPLLAIGGTLAFLTAKKSFYVLYYTFFLFLLCSESFSGGTRQLSGCDDFPCVALFI